VAFNLPIAEAEFYESDPVVYGFTEKPNRVSGWRKRLRQAMYLDWGGGAFGEVLEGGHIVVGDKVCWDN
jgi:hypothetical protein